MDVGASTHACERRSAASRRRSFARTGAALRRRRGLRGEVVRLAQPVGDRSLYLVAMPNVDGVSHLRPRPRIAAPHLRRPDRSSQEKHQLEKRPLRPDEKVHLIAREHDGLVRRVNPLSSELCGGLVQAIPCLAEFVGQVGSCHIDRRGPAVVRLATLDPFLAVMTLPPGHAPLSRATSRRSVSAGRGRRPTGSTLRPESGAPRRPGWRRTARFARVPA